MIPRRDPKQNSFSYGLMTISKIHIEFHEITSFGCPWKVLVGPWEVHGGALEVLGVSLGCPWGSVGVLGGLRWLRGILANPTRKMS